MHCQRCLKTPGYHSFEYIADVSGLQYFYTFPAQNKESVKNQEDMMNYVSHFPKDKPWCLLFHANGYGLSHMMPLNVAFELAKLIQNNYSHCLQKIYIIEGNWFYNFLYLSFPFLKKEIRDKFILVEGSQLEVVTQLRKEGLTFKQLEPLHKRFGKN